jgi:hypothetical protein
MASSISPVSYLNSVYQSLPASFSASAAGAGTSSTAEWQALQTQGDLKGFFNDSVAAALLQPANGINSGTAASALVNNMLQQVLGAYQTPGSTSSSSTSAVG